MEVYIILVVFGLWLGVASFFLFRLVALFNKLAKGVEVGDLKKVLEKILADEVKNEKNIQAIIKKVNLMEEADKLHIQRIGLMRFNPFKELGGDHSFSLAVLDGEDNGIIITSLHTRDRTRVYMKKLTRGKADIELSDEEKKALDKAK